MQLFIVACLVAVALASPSFQEFKAAHGKVYASEMEEYFREHIYNSNVEYIHSFNQEGHSWTLGVNEFADLLHTEFRKQYLMAPVDLSAEMPAQPAQVNVEALPASVDWRTKNAVTPIKNQGQCGSCWSFSSTGGLEGQHAINTGTLVSLSEENLVACSNAEGNQGCNGGLMTQAFQYVITNGGIDTEASYPYTSGAGVVGKCKYSAANIGATATGYTSIPTGSESALQNASALQGPISVAMDASLNSFQLYKSGIYAPAGCSSTALDHGVLAVGYGTSTAAYWIVKNSWGTTWGMQGYFELARNDNNMCGIATMASFPTGVESL
jgi:cathepsin L